MIEPIINNIALIPLILGIVQLVKKLGVKGEVLTGISAVLGILFGIVYQIGQLYPDIQVWINIVVYGLAIGLSTSGLYDLSKTYGNSKSAG